MNRGSERIGSPTPHDAMSDHDTIVIGGGQAGLAMSAVLTRRGIEHVVFERGRIGERWRSERWDSLRLLTPNWMTRLPGWDVEGDDGFMSKDEFVELLEAYAARTGSPVIDGVSVRSVTQVGGRFAVETDVGQVLAHSVVVATGQCGAPFVPDWSARIDPEIEQVHAARYRNPQELAAGAVLVVGAGASGLQIAAELAQSGRKVVLSLGRHTRAIRRYRGRDFWWWLDRTGVLSQTVDEVKDIEAARRSPSLVLSGARGGTDIDLEGIQRMGVRIAGRMVGGVGTTATFSDNAERDAADADDRLVRLLHRFDGWAAVHGMDAELDTPMRPLRVRVRDPLSGAVDLAELGVGTVVWATGYRPSYPWLHIPVLDDHGEIRHRRGVTPVPGLYVLGLRFQWRRDSHFIDGVGRDAEFLAQEIARRLVGAAVA